LASLEAMRAGAVASPHTLIRRYLAAAKRRGLTKEWAMRLAVWVERQIDFMWLDEPTPTDALELRELDAECADDVAEKKLTLHRSLESTRQRLDCLTAEMARERVLAARYQKELEACK
jgi:hypothetical protein